MRRRVLFTLSMPGCASWNGRWSGDGRRYVLCRTLPSEKADAVLSQESYSYAWPDGWAACVTVRELGKGERVGRSDGFSGYDWMVDRIISHGRILADHQLPASSAEVRDA